MKTSVKIQKISSDKVKNINRKIVRWNSVSRINSYYNSDMEIWEIRLKEALSLHCNIILVQIAKIIANELEVKKISLNGVVYHF